MKIGTMIGDVTRSFFKKPVTRKYPTDKTPAPQRLRGRVIWNKDNCSGCSLCVKDCPAYALELFTIDRKAKQFVMRYDLSCCTYCAQCEVSCNFDAITLSDEEWELADVNRNSFNVYYGDDAHVQSVLAKQAGTNGKGA